MGSNDNKNSNKKIPTKKRIIADNRKARHNYTIESVYTAGLMLLGWEVKSVRAGKVQISDAYVMIRNNAGWLIGSNISPLITADSHIPADPQRTRKLLLKNKEISKLLGSTQRKGFTIVPLNLHWDRNYIKIDIALASGKKQYDKRQTEKEREWDRQKQELLKRQHRDSF